jgi:hypothetical protein
VGFEAARAQDALTVLAMRFANAQRRHVDRSGRAAHYDWKKFELKRMTMHKMRSSFQPEHPWTYSFINTGTPYTTCTS